MSSEAGEPSSDDNILEKGDPNRAALDRLTKDYQDLSEKAQQLLTEKLFLENEMNQLKKALKPTRRGTQQHSNSSINCRLHPGRGR